MEQFGTTPLSETWTVSKGEGLKLKIVRTTRSARKDPLDILPAEMWDMIFAYVKDAQDWLNLYRVSKTFQKLFSRNRQHALFPKIFDTHLSEYLEEGLDLNQILQLRLVSRQWRNLMDTLLISNDTLIRTCREKYTFNDSASMVRLLEKFEPHSRPSVLGREAHFDYSQCEETMEEYGKLVENVLTKVGAGVEYLTITGYTRSDAGIRQFVRQVRNCVLHTPNLISLTVWCGNTREGLGEPMILEANDALVVPESKHLLLPSLEDFRFALDWHTEEEVDGVQELLDQVAKMCCKSETLERARFAVVPSNPTTFPNLDSADFLLITPQELDRLAGSSWPLSKLSLGWVDEEISVGVPELFGLIQTLFKHTLTELTIETEMISADDDDDDAEFRADLPCLETLKISNIVPFVHFTDLQNLIEFEICLPPGGDPTPTEISDRFAMEIDTSKIWESLPQLEGISCTRKNENSRRGLEVDLSCEREEWDVLKLLL